PIFFHKYFLCTPCHFPARLSVFLSLVSKNILTEFISIPLFFCFRVNETKRFELSIHLSLQSRLSVIEAFLTGILENCFFIRFSNLSIFLISPAITTPIRSGRYHVL